MRILFLTPWYPDAQKPNHGLFVRDQALAIARRHPIQVVSAKIDYTRFALSSLQQEVHEMQGVKETRIRVKQSLPVFNQLNYFIRVIVATLRLARKFKPDLIHGNIGYPGAFWAWTVARFLNVPFVITEHTRPVNNFRSGLHKFLTVFAVRRAAATIAVSRWHADEIRETTGVSPVVITNIVNFKKYPSATAKPSGKFQIGFLGGLDTPVKGLDLLLRACAMLPDDFTLHVGGAGSQLEQYKKLAAELGIDQRCIFYGAVPHEEVPAFMGRLHFFVSSSRTETFGIAMVEAMACGLPVVATDSGGPRDFITPQNGLLVRADTQSLAAGMTDMMRNFQRYDAHVIRDTVIHRFSDDRFLENIDKVYNGLLNT
jgi:L-malate glycosyltransferase